MIASMVLSIVGAQASSSSFRRSMILLGTPQQCNILSDWFGFFVQGLLFAFCCGSLLLKWYMENPRRKFKIFLLDSSKQIVGAGVIHCLNMFCAWLFASFEDSLADECAWYWVNIMIDTTFGCIICWAILKLTEWLFGYESGNYGKGAQTGIDWENNPDYSTWGKQIAIWCVIVSLMKGIVVIIMYIWSPFWEWLAILCTHWIEDRYWRLMFVMIITPTLMNMFQFWVTDSFLKWQGKKGTEREPLK